MSGIFGEKFKLAIFGESHGPFIGITLNGVPSGIKIDNDFIEIEMRRRRAMNKEISTQRNEDDKIEIISGVFNNYSTGTPLTAIIKNKDVESKDYTKIKGKMRPSHADYTGYIKYNGFNDYRGGGHFSGRLTAPLVFAGAVAKMILNLENIKVGAHILKVLDNVDDSFNPVNIEGSLLKKIYNKKFPVINDNIGENIIKDITKMRSEGRSIGGVIECCVINPPKGIGEPFFDSFESVLSHLLFSIPAVKGVEFGKGFDFAQSYGDEVNDEMYMDGNEVKHFSNNNGGIIGGITNGMPIIFKVAVKPTPSIKREQKTVDIIDGRNTNLKVEGRHDAFIAHRAVPVVEAVTAISVLDMILRD